MDPHNNNPNEPRCTDQEQIFSNLENACLNIIDACDTIEMLCKSEESSSPTSKGWEGETSTSDGMASASDVKQADVKPKDPQPEPEMPTGDAVGELLDDLKFKLEVMHGICAPEVVMEEDLQSEDKK